jgi:hypothetical protein
MLPVAVGISYFWTFVLRFATNDWLKIAIYMAMCLVSLMAAVVVLVVVRMLLRPGDTRRQQEKPPPADPGGLARPY